MDLINLLTENLIVLTIIIIWAIVAFILKGFALYRAARKKAQGWFWLMLIFNTGGILPLIYLLTAKKEK